MNPPLDVQCVDEARLLIWRPRGILDEAQVNRILAFIAEEEDERGRTFDRFTDLSSLDAVDLTFDYVFQVALHRRISRAGKSTIKSAFLVPNPAVAHYVRLHAALTDHSPLKVKLFKERESAAKWLEVAPEFLAPAK